MSKFNLFNPPKFAHGVSIPVGESIPDMVKSFIESTLNNGFHPAEILRITNKIDNLPYCKDDENSCYGNAVSILFAHVKNTEDGKNLRVWWIPQFGMTGKPFYTYVDSIAEAILIYNTLANYDLYQLENRIKPDYSNAGGLEFWDEAEKEWCEYSDFFGLSIDEIIRESND